MRQQSNLVPLSTDREWMVKCPNRILSKNIYIEARYDHTLFGQGTPILGLSSLFDEMQNKDPSLRYWTVRVLRMMRFDDHNNISISLKLFQNIQSLSKDPLIGLCKGKTKLSDFGVYGYALYSSRNFQQAVELGIRHIKLASPVLQNHFIYKMIPVLFEVKKPLLWDIYYH